MLYRSYRPSSPLADLIEDFWLYAEYTPPHLKERILPSGTVELVLKQASINNIYNSTLAGVG
jgi:hypothetical protein